MMSNDSNKSPLEEASQCELERVNDDRLSALNRVCTVEDSISTFCALKSSERESLLPLIEIRVGGKEELFMNKLLTEIEVGEGFSCYST